MMKRKHRRKKKKKTKTHVSAKRHRPRVRSEMQRSRLNRKIQFPRTPNDATERGRGRQHPSNARSHPAKQRVPINGGATQPSSRTGPRGFYRGILGSGTPRCETNSHAKYALHAHAAEREREGKQKQQVGPRGHGTAFRTSASPEVAPRFATAPLPKFSTDAPRHADIQVTRTRMRKQAPTRLLSATFVYKQAGGSCAHAQMDTQCYVRLGPDGCILFERLAVFIFRSNDVELSEYQNRASFAGFRWARLGRVVCGKSNRIQ